MPGEPDPDRPALAAAESLRNFRICQEFEAAWRSAWAALPRLEDHLGRAAVPARESLLDDLLRLEVALIEAHRPARRDYRDRFPGRDALIDSLPPGAEDRYELIEEIGRGGMGVVYRAVESGGPAGLMVAVKMIHPSWLESAEMARRFQVEARELAGIQHPNVVRVLGSGQIGGQPYFAMEYVPGPNLAERIRREGPFDPRQAAELVLSIAGAVSVIHGADKVHLDLKPANILTDGSGRPLVSDFGLVRALEPGRRPGSLREVAGAPSYMAPEQAEGRDAEIGRATDVYGLGAILYALLTGRPPFRGRDVWETLEMVTRGNPVPPGRLRGGIPRDLELACMTCLAKSPKDRYPTAAALAEDLLRISRGEPPSIAREPRPLRRLARWAQRKPALTTRLGVVLACLATIWLEGPMRRSGLSMLPEGLEEFLRPSRNPFSYYWINTTILLIWGGSSWLLQWAIDRVPGARWLRSAWMAVDVAVLTALLSIARALMSPLVAAYPVLVLASGLWLSVRAVAVTTALAVVGYLLLALPAFLAGPVPLYLHFHFATAMVTTGLITVYQVSRIRALGRRGEPVGAAR